MSSIEPNPNNVDINNQYALNIENAESFAQLGIGQNQHFSSDHAKVFVNQPVINDAMKELMGETKQRRWAVFQLPKTKMRNFLYEHPNYLVSQLESNLEKVQALNCKCKNKSEQKLREQEKAVLEAFCKAELQRKQDYEALHLRILEFIQA